MKFFYANLICGNKIAFDFVQFVPEVWLLQLYFDRGRVPNGDRSMKIAVLADIHANHVALQACIDYVLNRNVTTFTERYWTQAVTALLRNPVN